MSLRSVVAEAVYDAFDSNPEKEMLCPYCGAKADRVGGPLYYWQCPKCKAFGTTFEWEQAHRGNRIRRGEFDD